VWRKSSKTDGPNGYEETVKSLTRDPRVTVSADTRGNLGPASVVVQDPPGDDWIKDRWQAASDMGGTAIPGQHWLLLNLGRPVRAKTAVLDWEAAYADWYKLEARIDSSAPWRLLYDGKKEPERRTTAKVGQSPGHGVAPDTPLHVIHTVPLAQDAGRFQELRLTIETPAAGWGVSLWQLDLYP